MEPPQNYNDCDYTPAVTDAALSGSLLHSMRRMGATFLGRACQPACVFQILSCSLLLGTAKAQTMNAMLPPPGQLGQVTCALDQSQTYAVYLPSSYTPAKHWPIIYFFDPAGHGRRPLDLYKDIAETYGYIFVGSNNSRNFSSNPAESVNALWLDTHQRLAVDEHRVYASGFSGGARVAGAMALSCPQCQLAGVIAHGAGYPTSRADSNDKLLYFFAVGNRDFNWPEVMMIRRHREEHGQPYRVRVFNGSHEWAPPEVMDDAVQWLTLKSMQSGVLPRDPAFVDKRSQQIRFELVSARNANDAIGQLNAYRSLVSDFAGLKPVDGFEKDLAVLEQSALLKQALKAEKQQIDGQFSLERDIWPKLRNYVEGDTDDPNALRLEIVRTMSALKKQADHMKDENQRLVYARAYEDLRVQGIENGQQELEAKHFAKAETCFQLMSEISDDPWPHLLLAETHALSGNFKQAIRELEDAVRRGLKDSEMLDSDPRLQVLKSEPGFQNLIVNMKRP